jgi:DMSO/TMAO reductase YedYZ molybdopterin-dependent catalytic subunit
MSDSLITSRRVFLRSGAIGVAAFNLPCLCRGEPPAGPDLTKVAAQPEYLTREEDFRNVGRGKPPPHELPPDRRRAVGLVPETWRLEVVPDPESDAKVDHPLSRESATALTWADLMKLADRHAVRFLSVMSCTNMPGPLGMGLWEGVPLREIIWLARPTANVRRVFYYGYHNDDPAQRFQSSLTLDRVLEDPPGELPVILCYKLNGQWLTPKRGAPVRMVVPGAYGNKSVKWLQRIVLTNKPQLNDTYAEWNNDTESALKTCATFLPIPERGRVGQPVPIRGLAQVGLSGLSKVQYWLHPQDRPLPKDDPHFTRGDWRDAELVPPPEQWGGGLPDGKLPPVPLQFDPQTGKPRQWPLRHTIVHWVARLADLVAGRYDLRCRTLDAQGHAQPMPRPFLKSGHNAIQRATLEISAFP